MSCSQTALEERIVAQHMTQRSWLLERNVWKRKKTPVIGKGYREKEEKEMKKLEKTERSNSKEE